MKHFIHILLLAMALAVSAMIPAQAVDMHWSKYDLNFTVPDGGFVMENTPTFFAEHWDDMELSLTLYTKDEKAKKEVYSTSLFKIASQYNMYDVKKGKVKVKGFDGYSVEGIMPDGTRAIIVNLVSKKTDLVVQVFVHYFFGDREVVDDIVKSFSINKYSQPNREQLKQKVKMPDGSSQVVVKKSKEQLEQEKKEKAEREFERKKAQGKIKDI